MDISRRDLIGGVAIGAAAVAANLGSIEMVSAASLKQYKNEDFYKDGKFDVDAAKKAYYEMMEYYKYPIPERLRGADFWALDFGLGKFTEAGMAGIFWVNNKKDSYFGHEIYLLPGQMIPEHKHVKTEDAAAKMEGWHVRYGYINTYGEGEPTPGVDARIPESHKECCKARNEHKLLPGEVGTLAGAEQWHWMKAGPEGAIVSEYATYHDGAGLRFSHPNVKM
jgi:D-lyxose ketol-isomerase